MVAVGTNRSVAGEYPPPARNRGDRALGGGGQRCYTGKSGRSGTDVVRVCGRCESMCIDFHSSTIELPYVLKSLTFHDGRFCRSEGPIACSFPIISLKIISPGLFVSVYAGNRCSCRISAAAITFYSPDCGIDPSALHTKRITGLRKQTMPTHGRCYLESKDSSQATSLEVRT